MIYEKDGTMWYMPDLFADYVMNGSVGATTSTTPGANVSTESLTGPCEKIPSERLAAIAYDRKHVPRVYPHKWEFDEREVTWRCNCVIEPLRVSDAALAAFKG